MSAEIVDAKDNSFIRALTRTKEERRLREEVKAIELIAENDVASHVIAAAAEVRIQGIQLSSDEARVDLIERELQSTIQLSSAAQTELAKSMTAHVVSHEATIVQVDCSVLPNEVKQRLAQRFSVARAKTMQATAEVFGVQINKPR